MRLSARKPENPAYPKELKTLGDHLRKRRLDLGLLQREVAQKLGIDEDSVCHWETGYSQPKSYIIPRIYDFLGYAPYERPEGFGAWLLQARRAKGLSRRKLALKLGMDVTTIDRWERGHGQPTSASVTKAKRFLGRL